MVKVAKITRIVAPAFVFVSMIFAIVALATGNSIPWLTGTDVRVQPDAEAAAQGIDEDPFIQDCGTPCSGLPGIIIQLEFYIGHSFAEYCGLDDSAEVDPLTDACDETNDNFPILADQTYNEWLFDESEDDGELESTAFVMLYDGCDIGSTTVYVVTSLAIVLMFVSLLLDVLSFKKRFDKPLVSTFFLLVGWAFLLASLITWVLTCQATATTLYSGITIGLGFIFMIVSIIFGFLGGVVRILRVRDFQYQQTVYI